MATTLVVPESSVEGPPPRLWTREEYHRMEEVGILGEDARTELIGGQIVLKMPQGKSHVLAIRLAVQALRTAFGAGYDVNAQLPLPLSGHDEPEPDILVLRGDPRDYEDRDPDPRSDVALAVEVSASSLAYDRNAKSALYAANGVPEYWIVNLRDRVLEVRRGAGPEGYAETHVFREGDFVTVGAGTVAVSDVFPRGE